ncbi:MAG: fasciclin domain-containing protein [Ilumatobacteraceae bacterium]
MNPSLRTRRSNRTRFALAAVAVLSLTAAACGDDENDASSTEAPMTTMASGADSTMAPGTTEAMGDMTGMPFGPACEAVPMDGEGSFDGMADDPAATAASNNPVLSTLVSAVDAAGLVDTLNGDGPFTIFAPTNDAFAAIPEDQLNAILADTDLLTSILTYHVVAGESLDAEGLGEAGMADTVNGGALEFGADGTTVNGVDVVCSDVTTASATVHIIDEVLLPPDMMMDESMGDDSMTDDSMGDDSMGDEMGDEMALAPSGPALRRCRWTARAASTAWPTTPPPPPPATTPCSRRS